jgi:UDP-glucose 4-epimerase
VKLLVTGGAGFIGSVVTLQLLEAGHEVTVLDDLSTGHRDAVPAGAAFVELDVRDSAQVLSHPGAPSYDGVLHFAAKSLVGESTQHPERYWDNNVTGTLALLEAMRAVGVPRLVFSSSAATYGASTDTSGAGLLTETTPTAPTSPYGASKLAVDLMVAGYAAAYGLAAVSLRYFNVAGAYGGLGERHATETHLIPNALRAVRTGEPLRLFGDDYPTDDGTCIRDYIHVGDLAVAHLAALTAATPGRHDVVNLGTGTGFSVREVITAVEAVTGRSVPVVLAERRPGDPPSLVASNALARELLGWAPTQDVQQMVSDAWELVRG